MAAFAISLGMIRKGRCRGMVRIAISVEAFEAICATVPLGSMSFENKTDEHGQRLIWLDPNVVDR